jgi:hypothetical protein
MIDDKRSINDEMVYSWRERWKWIEEKGLETK